MQIERCHENPEVLHVNTLADRAYYISYESERAARAQRRGESRRFHLLNGRWDFRYYDRFEDVPQDVAAPGFNWIDADGIDVPCSWQAQGWGDFQYVNIDAIIPYDFPRVPKDNPCGAYHRCFQYRKSRRAPSAELVFEGVDSCFYVWLNGRFLGYSQVSHATSIFDVSEFLVNGENELVVLNLKYCDGTYFENQDKFRLTGIFRDVYLLDRARTRVRDFRVRTELRGDFREACVAVEAEIENPRPGAELRAKLSAPDGGLIGEVAAEANSQRAELRFEIEHPLLWNAEQPNLYDLVLSLDGEHIPQQVGLRSVSVEGGALCVNGSPVKLKGVNMHESDPRTGNAVGPFQYDEGLKQMKAHNVNAIRTSHYPCPPVMMEYCNRYGFYVISEADLETHGAGQSEGLRGYNPGGGYCRGFHELASALMDDPACRSAVLDRVRKNPIRDKNQCAVILWSLGNESGWGENLEIAGRWVKEYDPTRLVHYENLYNNPKRAPDFSMLDVTSRMYPSLAWLRNHFEGAAFDPGAEFIACMGGFTERYLRDTANVKPLILCEFTHAMGNSSGDVGDYFDLIYKHPSFAGGFVWEWRDHAKYAGDTLAGRPKFLYGGDMGEFPNDGNFCVDGLTAPDGAPHSSLREFKNVTRPARAELTQGGKLRIRSCLDFADLRDVLTCAWELTRDGEVVERGALELPSVPPHGAAELPLPCAAAGEGWRHLRLSYRAKRMPAVPEGHELGFDQIELGGVAPRAASLLPGAEVRGKLRLQRGARHVSVRGESNLGEFAYAYDAERGIFSSLAVAGRELLSKPMEYNIYRAPTDNDLRGLELDAKWRDMGYDRAVVRASEPEVAERDGGVEISTKLRFAAIGRRCFLEGDVRWRVEGDGRILLAANMRRPGHLIWLPRFGLRLFLREDLGRGVEYLGFGPGECYPDKRNAAWLGRFRTDVDSLFEDYIRPQENGSHLGCRYLRAGDGPMLLVAAPGDRAFSFNASRFPQEELMRAAHNFELAPGRDTVLCLDYMQSGIGSGSCGPELEKPYRLDAEEFCFEIALLPLGGQAARRGG